MRDSCYCYHYGHEDIQERSLWLPWPVYPFPPCLTEASSLPEVRSSRSSLFHGNLVGSTSSASNSSHFWRKTWLSTPQPSTESPCESAQYLSSLPWEGETRGQMLKTGCVPAGNPAAGVSGPRGAQNHSSAQPFRWGGSLPEGWGHE